ncbi:MAG TPA: Cof-type HAD-IIB family hydrolase [Pyrinomonadaceae bacterium]|nr:Cof-type HAD-IIB family hydrolase [Pyrinomonadaceae bacterium]
MSIQLLALDLDGTLLNSRGEVSEGNREALNLAREQGVRVALVTGRRFRDARPLALELGLDVPLISHNGALTRHARTLETIAMFPLPLEAAKTALSLGRASGADPLVSDDQQGLGVLVFDKLNGENSALAKYIAWARRIHGDDGAVKETSSLEEYLDHDPIHVTFTGRYQAMTELSDLLKRELGAAAKISSTMYSQMDFALVDVLSPQASKGMGVAAVASELNLSPAEVMAMGDNFNDLEMLRYAGVGVLMGNAQDALLANEDLHITGTNDEDGVAQAIRRFILEA